MNFFDSLYTLVEIAINHNFDKSQLRKLSTLLNKKSVDEIKAFPELAKFIPYCNWYVIQKRNMLAMSAYIYDLYRDTGLLPDIEHTDINPDKERLEHWQYISPLVFEINPATGFEFAKNILIEDSQSEEPFNLTLLTADMHFPDGLMTENTPKLFEQQYSNVIHYSDYMLGNFIRWVQQQSFYDNTTIVIAGDHLSMDPSFFNGIPEDYERTVFNLFINSPVTTLNNTNRSFSTLDLFPTTLSALGVSIEGNRLGLGTNLFSEEMTLMEKLGFDEFSNELSKTSSFYNQQIMQGSDLEVK